jgi:hypothetical protein
MKSRSLLLLSHLSIAVMTSLVASIFLSQYFKNEIVNAQISDQNFNSKLTPWKVVDSSLAELLNNGWKIVGQSSHRVTTVTSGGIGAIDETHYVYTLLKGGKHITCSLFNPVANQGAYGKCRLLN